MENNLAIARTLYTALADPLKYIMVEPDAITHHCPYHMRTKRMGGQKLDDWGKILDGDWDHERRQALETGILRARIAEHFIGGKPWELCALWGGKVEKIRERGRIDGCRNEQELNARYQRLDRVYSEVRADSRLRSAQERGVSFADDLFVSIGRDGHFLFGHGGSHRLAIAQLLHLPAIPVRVLMRHAGWQRTREQVAAGGDVAWAGHPDLADLSPSQHRCPPPM